ncbi:conjugal transfer protein, partial [Salmonella enterica subsp. enterica serovar Bonn]|nr:conjugal transfer protein [Salmonella enterica subsp. enterica serovar Bonn]
LVVAVPALNLVTSDAAATAGLLVTALEVWLVSLTDKSLPRFWPADFFPVFYTCHLTALGILAL